MKCNVKLKLFIRIMTNFVQKNKKYTNSDNNLHYIPQKIDEEIIMVIQ
jgi:hypothetical protein